ncbi:MAG: 2TM domain-containing protein [Flavipsychrobacter sp.]|nr:2TM domain-containing protein [Flavipsychrobacter sp.]
MPRKIKPTGAQKRNLLIHLVVFAIATAASWMLYDDGTSGWAYPWPAWTTAAWGLAYIGHWCAVYTSYEDKGHEEYTRQANN